VIEQFLYAFAVLVTVSIPAAYWWRYRSHAARARAGLQKAAASGLEEPITLHPRFDLSQCIATGACVRACPEGDVIGLVGGAPVLVAPNRCIGHGACAAACPVDAISLVFGSERRGVDIPHVKETFETNVPGLYIAGELGGMGLIRNAVTQGREAIEYLTRDLERRGDGMHDVAIVGAGPAGLAATLQAEKEGLGYVTLEQEDIGGTLLSYPRHKIVMTQSMDIPIYGKCRFRRISKEELLDLWNEIIDRTGVRVHTKVRVEGIERRNGHFRIVTTQGEHEARRVVLAVGRRGTPRKLGVPGEQSGKVTYRLLEPEQYRGSRVLVVGGGDSAVEAALALARVEGCTVGLSYRKSAFGRVKEENQQRLEEVVKAGDIALHLASEVREIRPGAAVLEGETGLFELPNDYVLVFIGGELPTAFLQKIGVSVEKKFGER
jgi:thioredoxin reductase (NADPH)